jgi:hypothetical protein
LLWIVWTAWTAPLPLAGAVGSLVSRTGIITAAHEPP